jgi:phage terminase large subunit
MPNNKIRYSDIFNEDMISYYQKDPVSFVEDIIFNKQFISNGGELYLSDHQKDFLRCIPENKRISVRSGRGIGKSSGVSFVILWFLCCFANPKVICSSPSRGQLESVLWPEVNKWLSISLVKDIFEHTATKLVLKENPKNWFCATRTSSKGSEESASGLHETNLLIIVDEASAVGNVILEGFNDTLSKPNNKLVLISNATRTDGFFFDTHNKLARYWCCRAYSSEDSPFCDKEEIKQLESNYGRDHDNYLVSVLGEFPRGTSNSFITLADAMAAVNRDIKNIDSSVELGVDVARMGDDLTAICWREGYDVRPMITRAKSKIPETCELVLSTVKSIRRELGYKDIIRVKVDDTGVGGGLSDLLELDRENNIEVIKCNFGGKGDDHYYNEASQMWGTLRDVITKIRLPNDDKLIRELAARRWGPADNGKIKIESKKDFKADYGASPDRADALVLCFARKQSERVVLKDFDFLDETVVRPITGYMANGEKYISIYYSSDKKFSSINASWVGNKLYILDEMESDDSIYQIANHIVSGRKVDKIIGNEIMFKKFGDDIRSQFEKFNIDVQDNYRYDEPGAIEILVNMTKLKTLVIDSKCIKTIDQFRKFHLTESRRKLEIDYGLVYSILNLVSELKEKIERPQEQPKFFNSYGLEKQRFIDNIAKGSKYSSFDSWLLQ